MSDHPTDLSHREALFSEFTDHGPASPDASGVLTEPPWASGTPPVAPESLKPPQIGSGQRVTGLGSQVDRVASSQTDVSGGGKGALDVGTGVAERADDVLPIDHSGSGVVDNVQVAEDDEVNLAGVIGPVDVAVSPHHVLHVQRHRLHAVGREGHDAGGGAGDGGVEHGLELSVEIALGAGPLSHVA